MGVDGLAKAIKLSPWRFLSSQWPYRAVLFTAVSLLLAPISIVAIGTVLLIPVWGAVLARIDWKMLALAGGRAIDRPGEYVPQDRVGGWLSRSLGTAFSWRECAYVGTHIVITMATVVALTLVGTLFATGALIPALLVKNAQTATQSPLGDPEPSALLWAIPLILLSLAALLYAASGVALCTKGIATHLLSMRTSALERQVTLLARNNAIIQDDFDERLRELERRIHDGTQIRLSTAALHLGILEHRLRALGTNPDDLARCMDTLEAVRVENELAQDALRESIGNLRPRALQEGGLVAAIQEVTKTLPLSITVEGPTDVRLPVGAEYSLLQVAKEALANIAKHANARRVYIGVSVTDAAVRLVIRDDGQGGANPFVGSGIIGIQERAHLLGGSFDFSSPVGGPTQIALDVPLTARLPARTRRFA